ncbi:hypothetical protein HPP92_006302 [Vanilla planifolia]|uniref:Uncharacterized protein n=1 Tax=Vanilla planifolia TaxID=51239 RepID=A0A835VFJ0_VANPL|nr:hypothetical protein HPP92_006302 [Vanilla planifolia]
MASARHALFECVHGGGLFTCAHDGPLLHVVCVGANCVGARVGASWGPFEGAWWL